MCWSYPEVKMKIWFWRNDNNKKKSRSSNSLRVLQQVPTFAAALPSQNLYRRSTTPTLARRSRVAGRRIYAGLFYIYICTIVTDGEEEEEVLASIAQCDGAMSDGIERELRWSGVYSLSNPRSRRWGRRLAAASGRQPPWVLSSLQ